ncbi:hypothetical protein WMY93_024557 [Mugilogobius chulae]|uniref:L1 transposable element RRM domain-containing protein n=1 Tax=Mugilogobius chulae TaxID=88201 RepID=A0AAW0N9X2_9GOBI
MKPKKNKYQSKSGEEEEDLSQSVEAHNDPVVTGAQSSSEELAVLIRTILKEEISVVVSQLNIIKEDIASCTRKLVEVDETLSTMDERVTKLETACTALRKANLELKEKAERLEMHSRKYNVRVFGLAKDVEKGNPTGYMSQLFKELFQGKLQSEPDVEIAHRVGPPGNNRAMIVSLQKRTTTAEIIKIAKKEKELLFCGMKLKIFPDLTTEMAKKRASFRETRAKLRDEGVRHGIIHPATLIITFKGETKKFTEHSEADLYVKTVIQQNK